MTYLRYLIFNLIPKHLFMKYNFKLLQNCYLFILVIYLYSLDRVYNLYKQTIRFIIESLNNKL